MKQIEDLPLAGRNVNQLSRLTAGYNGTWNGLPTFAQSNSIDGIVGNTNRWRYQTSDSAASIAVTPRIENIAEMVVSSDQMDMNQGFGSSSMSVSYVTRRGTNRFSGRLYEGFRAQYFDATNWGSTVKPKYHRNDFGASLGGPIMKDKLFFFASMAALDVPGGTSRTQNFLSDAAKQGVFTYANGAQANLFSIFAAHNAANGTSFPASVAQINPMTAARIAAVDGYRQNDGGLAQASAQPTDRNLRTWEWQRENSNRTYYPTIRVDSNLSEKWRLNVAINQTKQDSPHSNPDFWPGDGRAAQGRSNNATASLGMQTHHVTHPDQRVQRRVAVHGPVVCPRRSHRLPYRPENQLQLRGLQRHLLCGQLPLSAQHQRVQHHDLDEGLPYGEVRRQLVSRGEQVPGIPRKGSAS